MVLEVLNMWTLVLGGAVAAVAIYLLSSSKKHYKNLPPGPPPPLPVFGHLWELLKNKMVYKYITNITMPYGKVVRIRLGVHDAYVLNGYDTLKEAFVDKSDVFSERPSWLNTIQVLDRTKRGVLFHDDWRERRRFILVSMRDFGLGKTSLEERMVEEARYLMEEIGKCDGQPFDPTNILPCATANIVCSIIVGNRYQYGDKKFKFLQDSLNTLASGKMNLYIQNFIPFCKYLPTGNYRQQMAAFHGLMAAVGEWEKEHSADFDPENMRDLVDLFINESRKEDTKLEKMDMVLTILELFGAGTETTSTTLAWALIYLVHHPEIQQRCKEDIQEAIGPSRPPLYEDNKHTPYIHAFLNETQRMSNTTPLSIWHAASVDTELAGYTIPKSSIIIPNMITALNDPKYWNDPETFNPDRWLNEDNKIIKNQAFVPFSMGKRACLGEQLAKKEMYIFLTTMLQNFTFTVVQEGQEPSLDGIGAGDLVHSTGNYKIRAIKV